MSDKKHKGENADEDDLTPESDEKFYEALKKAGFEEWTKPHTSKETKENETK